MEKATETTFKDLQQDERYKRLERTLKMVLLKNNEAGNGNPSAWPSISSINCDNLDTSCAQSVQSSRFGSEIVSSSLNLRNILPHKKSSFPPRRNVATSSENQFPINKDNDSVIMPPPKTPGPSLGRSRKFGAENKRAPLLNVSINLDGNDNGFARSHSSTASSTNSQRLGPRDENPVGNFGEKNDFPPRNLRDESDDDRRSPKPQERVFSRWRVLLNDKAQLIIKGTLECGKTARSKPVIRRLNATSVQSIFKHIYHLRGNLVDERNELPDYVRGKFYNGFPDDWENVYQVWRNYVSDGSKLSFRWPTPITDSDDDITSEVTEVSYQPRFEKLDVSRSPRKRQRYATRVDDDFTEEHHCPGPRSNASAARISHEQNSSKLSGNSSKSLRGAEASVESAKVGRNKSLRETSFEGSQRVANNSLKDIIQEDKLNIIIDNLTNKNCSLEYIQKIVEMFDCLKYLVSYRTPDEADDGESASKNLDESSCSRRTEYRPPEEKRDNAASLPSVNPPENHQPAATVADSPGAPAKLPRDRCTVDDARRKLTRNDYESEDSDDEFFVARKRASLDQRSNGRTARESQALDDFQRSPRIERRYRDRERSRVASRPKSVGQDEFATVQRFDTKDSRDRIVARPRKSGIAENGFHGTLDRYDSSISLTEDENALDFRKEARKTRVESYVSSVSIMEEQRDDDVRGDRNALDALNYYSESNSRDPSAGKDDSSRDGQKGTLKYSNRSNCSSVDSGIDRNPPDRRNLLKASSVVASIRLKENSQDYGEDFSQEHREDSAYLSLDAKRQKGSSTIGTAVETESKVKKKPVVVSSEPANIDIRRFCTKNENKNDVEIKMTQKEQRCSTGSVADFAKPAEIAARATKKGNVSERNNKTEAEDTILEKEKPTDSNDKSSEAKFGSESNPKKLTGWVPAVICEDDSQCRLVFEGKLINEAGHVANRKFTTNFVKRRVNPKLIETVDRVFYQLVGDLNDTKHVVPKDLVKQCHNGCPSKINHFCEKWKLLSTVNNESPMNARLHNTSVDCLSVPTSSRGRRILPPLNYWTGERITTKDNKAIYNPGNFQEPSITSSLEKTNEDISSDRKSPRAGRRRFPNRETKDKRADVPAMDGANKKDMEKPSSPTTRKSPTRESPRRTRNGKRRLVRQMRDSSSESDEVEAKPKVPLRKRRTRSDDPAPSAKSTSKAKSKNPGKNTTSSQSLEQSTSSISFEKPAAPDAKLKLRKRRKINQDQVQAVIAGASKQLPTRGSSEVTCTLYRNVPLHSGDLSEDQLSTM